MSIPKFSIVLPVRNGSNYVKECLNSILSQTYPHFNLIVLDNDSTDGTPEWIMSLKDERISIYPSTEPLAIEKNWARILSVPKNEFITLIGHDDILYPDYLTVMDKLISKYPTESRYKVLRGDIFMQQKMPAKAFEIYQAVLKDDPQNAYVYVSLSEYYKSVNKPDKALESIVSALKCEQLDVDTKVSVLGQYVEKLVQDSTKFG